MIRLDGLTKRFAGQEKPAVDKLTLDIARGEIVVLVGPSGCGKTTSLRLVNRLIEPSDGRIIFDGEDVTDVDADDLRRRMGYVIQQLGLFPHMTVAQNIAVVPKILGWDKERIAERTDELLSMVGLDPDEYRDRYPKELSGGQSQRVGVVRAMAADPPVLLMDEPFGAIDPVTRMGLQDEFLELQEKLRKTIVFVTHDIDEAVKMGDRIVILQEAAHIAQYDTPAHILTAPANDFVSDFIGSGALVRSLRLLRVRDIEAEQWPVVGLSDDRDRIRKATQDNGRAVLLVDDDRRPVRWIHDEDVRAGDGRLEEAGNEVIGTAHGRASLHDVLNEMLDAKQRPVVAVDDAGTYRGVIRVETIMHAVDRMREETALPAQED